MAIFRCLAFFSAVVFAPICQAGFITKGTVTVGGNSVRYAVEQSGQEFRYYYQIDNRIQQGTSQMFIASSGFESAYLTDDVTIDLVNDTLVSANGSTFNLGTLLFDPIAGVGIAGMPHGNKPTRLLTAISMYSQKTGAATMTVNGYNYEFEVPVPISSSPVAVPLPPALALIASGLPFASWISRRGRRTVAQRQCSRSKSQVARLRRASQVIQRPSHPEARCNRGQVPT